MDRLFSRFARLLLTVGFLIWSGCGTPARPGAPMRSNCRELPTTGECLEGANAIHALENERLWDCVRQQCTRITVQCGEVVRKRCNQASQQLGTPIMGYTFQPMGTSPFFPAKETYWCEEAGDSDCLTRALIHELAHSCGWEHQMGQGVPGNEGEITCE